MTSRAILDVVGENRIKTTKATLAAIKVDISVYLRTLPPINFSESMLSNLKTVLTIERNIIVY